MPQTNYTPILIYASGTTGNTPAAGNLTNSSGGSELAINYFDGKLFYKDASNVVRVLASRGTGTIGGSTNQVQYNSGGVLAGSANLTFDGNNLGVGSAAGSNARLFAYANDATLPTLMARQDGAGPMQVWQSTGGAEAMRFNSTGLGIGNSAPNTKLDITTTANNGIRLFQTGAANAWNIYTSGNNLRFIEENVGSVMAINAGGNVGIGTNSPGVRLEVAGSLRSSSTVTASYASGFDQTYISSNGATGNGCVMATVNFAASAYQPITYDASTYIWRPSGTERMRLDGSGNLGIGTISPAVRLDVEHSNNSSLNMFRIRNTNAGASAQTVMLFGNDVSSGAASISVSSNVNSTSSNEFSILNRIIDASSKITFGTQNTERARIDGSGNLGLGVTPSVSNVPTIQSAFGIFSGNSQANIAANAYYNIQWNYTSTAVASLYTQTAGQHRWFNAPSGTAGTAISFTQAMTLDASGNLGIGTSSPGTKLHVQGNAQVTNGTGANLPTAQAGFNVFGGTSVTDSGVPGVISVGANSNSILSGEVLGRLQFYSNDASAGLVGSVAKIDCLATNNFAGGEAQTALTFHTNTGVAGSLAERMRLDSSGNLGINATISPWGSNHKAINIGGASSGNIVAPANNMNSGTNYYNNNTNFIYLTTGQFATRYEQGSGQHSWHTAPSGTAGNAIGFTQSMTLDASGNLQLGTTTSGAGIGVTTGLTVQNSTNAAILKSDSSTGGFPLRVWNTATTGDNLFVQILTETVGTQRGSIDYNRAGGLTRYNTTSDYRAKDILGPVQNSGEIIDALKVYEGVMKGATQSRPMLIAHEAQEHAPYAVSGVKDEVKEDGTPKFQQMDVSSLVPLLLAEIQSLRARVAALESQP